MKPTIEIEVKYKIPIDELFSEDAYWCTLLDDYKFLDEVGVQEIDFVSEIVQNKKAIAFLTKCLKRDLNQTRIHDYINWIDPDELDDYDLESELEDILKLRKKFNFDKREEEGRKIAEEQETKNMEKEEKRRFKETEAIANELGYKLVKK
jgi:hypothetical protein